jgi:methionyl-tRNA formyltransferase
VSVVLVGGVEVSLRCLEALAGDGVPVALAVGYPESLAGRSGYASLQESCGRLGIPLLETADINAPETAAAIRSSGGRLLVVTGWSQLLRTPLLELCELGAVGMHPTRLPRGRGRAPIPWTLIKGLSESAVTLFHLTEGVDDGDIVAQAGFEVGPDEDAADVYAKVTGACVQLVREFVPRLLEGSAPRTPQDHSAATYWPRRRPEDGLIDWAGSARDLHNWVRGLTRPYPGAFTTLRGERLTVWKARPAALPAGDRPAGRPGEVTAGTDSGVLVSCGDGELLLLERLGFGAEDLDATLALQAGRLRVGDVLGGDQPCARP